MSTTARRHFKRPRPASPEIEKPFPYAQARAEAAKTEATIHAEQRRKIELAFANDVHRTNAAICAAIARGCMICDAPPSAQRARLVAHFADYTFNDACVCTKCLDTIKCVRMSFESPQPRSHPRALGAFGDE